MAESFSVWPKHPSFIHFLFMELYICVFSPRNKKMLPSKTIFIYYYFWLPGDVYLVDTFKYSASIVVFHQTQKRDKKHDFGIIYCAWAAPLSEKSHMGSSLFSANIDLSKIQKWPNINTEDTVLHSCCPLQQSTIIKRLIVDPSHHILSSYNQVWLKSIAGLMVLPLQLEWNNTQTTDRQQHLL